MEREKNKNLKILEDLYVFFDNASKNEPEIKKNLFQKVVYFWYKERERELIRDAILMAIKKSIGAGIADSGRVDFLCSKIALYFSDNTSYLVKCLLFSESFFVVYSMFLFFIASEHDAKIAHKKMSSGIREYEKDVLSKHLLKIGENEHVFRMINILFFYADVIPPVSQTILYRRWVALFSLFGEAKELIDYYEQFRLILPNLRLHMKKSTKELLGAVHFVGRKTVGGIEIADYSEMPSPIPNGRIKN